MKKQIALLLFSSVLLLFSSCQSTIKKTGDFKLLPTPQNFVITGVSNLKYDQVMFYYGTAGNELPKVATLMQKIQKGENSDQAQVEYSIDSLMNIKEEGYKLDITENKIKILAKDKAGLLYAFMTLEQLLEDAKEQDVNLPLCKIVDFPILSYRAIHLDVKHHLEKTDYYFQLLDKLAKYKVNAIILEIEDKLKYKRQPEVASSDALSSSEWQRISNYARERNIEISPLVQGLGHASFILKHEKYKDLRDDPKLDWAFNPLDPKTYEVQFDLYLDAMEATPHGKYLHIGGDEVHTTGRNSGKSPLELQLIWLEKVCKFAEEHNRIPIFWDDMPLKHAGVYKAMFDEELSEDDVNKIWKENEFKLVQFLDKFPKNCIYMRWNYDSSEAIGNGKAMQWFVENGLQVMGATAAQTRWVLMPQEESNINNIRSFASSSIKNGLNGLLLTLWDDDSPHFELYMRGIISFAEFTWAGEKSSNNELKSTYRQREFSNKLAGTENAFIDQLEYPVAFWKNALLKGNKRNYLYKMMDPIEEGVIDLPDMNNKANWSEKYEKRINEAKKVVASCDSISVKISNMKLKAVRNIYTLEVYEQVNSLAKFGPQALLVLNDYDLAKNAKDEENALKRLGKLTEEFSKLRKQLEEVYGRTRVLTKPNDYVLDQDYHSHLANQSISFDWQFYAELLFLEKIENEYKKSADGTYKF